jgi:lysophospholipase L1-like esterase
MGKFEECGMPAGKKIVARILLFALSLSLCLGAAEAVLRIKNASMQNYDIEMWRYAQLLKRRSDNPLLGHEHVPSTSAVLQSVEIRTNEYGLRGGPVPPPHAGQRRILFLGSSVTLGWGVPEDETTTGRLQKMFVADGQDVVVLNAGIGNYNAARTVERFLTQLQDLEPTDIVVHAFVRDAEVLDAGGGNWLLRNSQLAVVLWSALQRRMAGTGMQNLEEHYRKLYDPETPGYLAMARAFDRLTAYATKHNVRVYMAMVPDIHNLQDYQLAFVHDAMKENARKQGYRYLDLYPAFASIKAEDVWAMPGDPHPNRLGHQKMAEALYPFLALDGREK